MPTFAINDLGLAKNYHSIELYAIGFIELEANDSEMNNIEVLDRICEIYSFSQKIQLANHFKIAASSLSNRYTRGAISYDFAAHCSLETGASLRWLLTGQGERYSKDAIQTEQNRIQLFTLSEGKLDDLGFIEAGKLLFSKPVNKPIAVKSESKTYFVDQSSNLSDGTWLIDIEGSISIRELTLLPARKLHVAGGKIPFECGIDEIKTLGRVVGIYTEVN